MPIQLPTPNDEVSLQVSTNDLLIVQTKLLMKLFEAESSIAALRRKNEWIAEKMDAAELNLKLAREAVDQVAAEKDAEIKRLMEQLEALRPKDVRPGVPFWGGLEEKSQSVFEQRQKAVEAMAESGRMPVGEKTVVDIKGVTPPLTVASFMQERRQVRSCAEADGLTARVFTPGVFEVGDIVRVDHLHTVPMEVIMIEADRIITKNTSIGNVDQFTREELLHEREWQAKYNSQIQQLERAVETAKSAS